jgi:sigma-B regulation protein RsbU (phosphoserine phosphatase)
MQMTMPIQEMTISVLQHKMKTKNRQLHCLLQITEAINLNYSTDNLVDIYQNIIQNELGVDEVAFFIFNDVWKRKIWLKKEEQGSFIPIAENIHKYHEPKILDETEQCLFHDFKYLIPVYHKKQPIAFVLFGNIKPINFFKEKELLEFAQIITNIIAVAVENKRLFKNEVEKKEYKKELELASKIQGMLIPKKLPKNNLYQFDGIYIPYKGIGGDYYDVIHINKNEFVFCMADISGKGVSAALVMANIQAYLNAVLDTRITMETLINKLNKKIFTITEGDKYVTLFLAQYNIISKELTYVNCGHVPPVLIKSDNEVRLLNKGATMLGVFEELHKLEIETLKIDGETTIICCTDGLTELENEHNKQFGLSLLIDFAKLYHQHNPALFNKLLHEHISKFKGNSLFNDDISSLTGKFY